MKKEENNTLSVYQRDGLWYYTGKELTEDLQIIYAEKGGFQDAMEAFKACEASSRKFTEFFRSLSDITPTHFLLKDYLIYWYHKILVPRSDDSTKMTRGYELYHFILPNLGNYEKLQLNKVTASILTQIIKRCSCLCDSAAAQVRKFFSAAFLDAAQDGYINENPMSGVAYFSYEPRNPPVIYNKAQIRTLVQYCIHSASAAIRFYIYLGLFCGLRTGEIRGLRLEDFSKEEQTIHIQRQVVAKTIMTYSEDQCFAKRVGVSVKAPKTQSSNRTIKVHPVIFEALEEHLSELDQRRKRSRTWSNQYHGYVAIGDRGNIISDGTVNSALRRIAGNTGLPIISAHDLRHMAATLLFESCMENKKMEELSAEESYPFAEDLKRISRYLGHSSVRTTYETYIGHLYGSEKIRQVAETVMNPLSVHR